MIRRHGFTLIELLIVVTIIAILAGAAVPYVQDYVEQARVGRAKADLDEIKRAIMLYEVQYGPYTGTGIASLVGPFLTRNIPDPWGNAYVVDNGKSAVYSAGPDSDKNTSADNISTEFRPRMAVTRVTLGDVDGDGMVSSGDTLYVKTCRPIYSTDAAMDGLMLLNNEVDADETLTSPAAIGNMVSFNISVLATPISINKCTFKIDETNKIKDMSGVAARVDTIKVLLD